MIIMKLVYFTIYTKIYQCYMQPKKKEVKNESVVITTKSVDEISKKENLGVQLKRTEKIWLKNMAGVRKPGLTFSMTDDELTEYGKCKMSVQYFAEVYCRIKREDGTVGKITLRDYQKELLDLFANNRFSIALCSRQIGKCFTYNTKVIVNIEKENGDFYQKEMLVGELYYLYLKQKRKLKLIEKIKIYLYTLYNKI